MPRKHSEMQKRNAIDLLEIHDDINAVHLLTGIPHRTLRRWRKKLRPRQNPTLSAKRTMSDKVLTKQQPNDNPTPTPDAPRENSNTVITTCSPFTISAPNS